MHAAGLLSSYFYGPFHPPTNLGSIYEIVMRLIHYAAGITWVGMLYFFNLVNVQFMKALDGPTKAKVVPELMPRALWWFRWGAAVTVLAGIMIWMRQIHLDVANAKAMGITNASGSTAIWTFFVLWTLAFAVEMGLVMSGKVNGAVMTVIMTVVVAAAAMIFLNMNANDWISNHVLSIGIGGGMGWIMLNNVWGIIWRAQKKIILWTKANAENGTPIPPEVAKLARQAFLASRANFVMSVPMLFFMAAASHYPMFGR